MNTDTPETDAAFRDGYTFCGENMMPAVAFCGEMERQRNAALKRLDSSERARKSLSEACDFLQAKQNATERMVRELRDALDAALQFIGAAEAPQWASEDAIDALTKANQLLP